MFHDALELRLYWLRSQGSAFKCNAKWPAEQKGDVFWFRNQVIDGMRRTFLSGVPILTAFQALVVWAWANCIAPWTTYAENPVWLGLVLRCLPMVHEVHFYLVNRLIHVPVLCKWIQSVHHNSVNPSPWWSLSMHPVEHLLYWSSALLHLILPSHPFLALYQLQFAGFGAVVGQIGFDRIVLGDESALETHAYAHDLHHKHFEVNYSDATIPLDRLFGTWHDRSAKAEARMQARYAVKVARVNKSPKV